VESVNFNVKNKLKDYIDLLIVLITIVISDDTILFGTNKNTQFIKIKYCIIILLFFYLILNYLIKKKKVNTNLFFITITLSILIMFTSLINNDFRFGYFYRCGILVIGMFLSLKIPLHRFAILYDKIMEVLAVFSLIGYFISISFSQILKYLPIIYNSANNAFYTLLLTNISVNHGGFHRNYGLFREPGVFQLYLIVALLFQMFIIHNPKLKTQIIYLIALLTTFSTTGYIALMFIIFLYANKKSNFRSDRNIKIAFIMIFILSFTYLSLFTDLLFKEGYGSVFGKLFDSTRNSTSARIASILVNLRLFMESPIWGVGLSNVEYNFAPLAYQILGFYTEHNTNTLLIQLAQYGLIFIILWMIGICKLCKLIGRNLFNSFIIFILYNVLFIGSNLSFSLITNVLFAYGFSNYKQYLSINKK